MSTKQAIIKDTEMKSFNAEYLGIDLGFGDYKVTAGTKHTITKQYKEPAAVGAVVLNEHFSDSRIIQMGDESFYVGNDAMNLESGQIYELIEYAHLEKFTPVILHKIFRDLGCDAEHHPKKIVLGLSVAHIKNAVHYKACIDTYIKSLGWEGVETKILPQGSGVKVAYDKYGDSFPHLPQDFNAASNYLIADIGFNTLDTLYVMDGKVTTNNVRGIEKRGAVVMAAQLNEYIKSNFNREHSSKELKSILEKGYLMLRGNQFDLEDVIKEFKRQYLKMIEALMEQEFGKVLDKCNYILLSGGGAYFFKDVIETENFYRATKDKSEYMNSIGYFENARK